MTFPIKLFIFVIISQCSRLLGSGQQRIHPPRADAHLKMQCFSLLVLILEVLAWADKGDALNRQLILYISDVGSGYICEKNAVALLAEFLVAGIQNMHGLFFWTKQG